MTASLKTTVHYFFRGTWWPPCRESLKSLNLQAAALKAAGIKVVAITAEPGGDDAILDRLTEREVPKLDFEVKSDPEHKFLENAPVDLFIIEDKDYEVWWHYNMFQPALVVYGEDKKVISEFSWSWKTMGIEGDPEWNAMARIPTEEWAGPTKQVLLVTMRPLMSDLAQSILEKRKVKLGSTHDGW